MIKMGLVADPATQMPVKVQAEFRQSRSQESRFRCVLYVEAEGKKVVLSDQRLEQN